MDERLLQYFQEYKILARDVRIQTLKGIFTRIVENRDKTTMPVDITVNVPRQEHIDPVINLPAPVTNVDVVAPNVEIVNRVEVPDVKINAPIEVHVPEIIPTNIINLPTQPPPKVSVQLVVPPDAIKVEVNIPPINVNVPPIVIPQQQHPSAPTQAKITHSDGTKSKVELS